MRLCNQHASNAYGKGFRLRCDSCVFILDAPIQQLLVLHRVLEDPSVFCTVPGVLDNVHANSVDGVTFSCCFLRIRSANTDRPIAVFVFCGAPTRGGKHR